MSKVTHIQGDVYEVSVNVDGAEYTDKISLEGAKKFLDSAPKKKAAEIIKAMVKAIEDTQKPKYEVQKNEPKEELPAEGRKPGNDETGPESEAPFGKGKAKSKDR